LSKKRNWKLRDLIEAYKKAYCGKIGVEYMHIPDRDRCNWIRDKFESLQFEDLPKEKKILHLDRLMWANEF
jgi:2-oxoglutarate dehydrogenase E1 component